MRLSLNLLTRSSAFYTSERLLEAGRRKGLSVGCIDPGQAVVDSAGRVHQGSSLTQVPDIVIPRIGSRVTDSELS